MLLKLTVTNYALIQKLEIEWDSGFSVITGETGAGKSILVGALSLIVGQRAETAVLADKKSKCIVEGTFSIKNYGLEEFFKTNDLDYEDLTTLRREIAPNGKSRAFINDTPVNLTQLTALGDRLVNIHSQHSIITLSHADYQLDILDDYADNQTLCLTYRSDFKINQDMVRDLEDFRTREARDKGESDYQNFLFEELEKASLIEDEQEELEQRLDILSHAEEIKSGLSRSTQILDGEEINIIAMASEILSSLRGISSYHQRVGALVDRLESNLIDIKDIAGELQRLDDDVYFDPQEAERVSNRLDMIYRLQQKHQVSTIKDLLRIKEEIGLRLADSENLDSRIRQLESDVDVSGKALLKLARKISDTRIKAIPAFEKEILSMLKELGMPAAQFKIDCRQEEHCAIDGIDRIKFLFSANKGVAMDAVSRIASGGELSRLMLSIKSMISTKNLLPTIIFDEIDSGVSGEIAGKVGTILKRMSDHMQVIVITHLPQIAGKGEGHYWIYKEDVNGTTHTGIKKLSMDERVEEIAKMVSSDRVTEAAFQTAKELLMN